MSFFNAPSFDLDKSQSLAVLFAIEGRQVNRARKDPARPYVSSRRSVRTQRPTICRPEDYSRLFACSYASIEQLLSAQCHCGIECSALTVEDVVSCRCRNYSESDQGVTDLLAFLFWNFEDKAGKLHYAHKGKRVCKKKFQMLWGVGDSRMRSAHDMWKRGSFKSMHGLVGTLKDNTKIDWVYNYLLLYLQEESEVIADGKWHLHDTTTMETIHEAVLKEWRDPVIFHEKPSSSEPTLQMVTTVMRQSFPFVKWFRKGEFGQCSICVDLADRRKKGFADDADRKMWEFEHNLHAKIHRINRRMCQLRQAMIAKHPALYHGFQFDWTRP